MEQKHNRSVANRYVVSILAVLIAAALVCALVLLKNTTEAAPSSQPTSGLPQKTPGHPQFSFNAAGAPGWQQGPTDKVSMALFHSPHDCFTSVQHKTGTIAADKAKRQKTEDQLTGNGYVITPGATLAATLQTDTGEQSYELQQSSVTTPAGAEKIKGGQEFGYLQLSDGYLFVEGYCDAPEQLPATIPALQAIKFDAGR